MITIATAARIAISTIGIPLASLSAAAKAPAAAEAAAGTFTSLAAAAWTILLFCARPIDYECLALKSLAMKSFFCFRSTI